MPRGAGELRENQSGHWDNSCDAKRFTSALLNKSQIWQTCIEAGNPGWSQTALHLNRIQVNSQKHSLLRRGENTLLGVCSEAKSTNVAEDDIPVTAHLLPGVDQNEPIVQVIEYTNALEPQRGQGSIHAFCEHPRRQSQAKVKNFCIDKPSLQK